MKLCNAVTIFLIYSQGVAGFSILRRGTAGKGAFGGDCRRTFNSPRFGVLDDINSINGVSFSSSPPSEEEEEYEVLFNSLVFSTGNTRTDIQEKVVECSDPGFLQWLEWNMEESEDDEERQALQDLLEMIDQIVTEEAEAEQQLIDSENQQETQQDKEEPGMTDTTATTRMSTSDILKKANAIDHAVMVAEASEDEKPLDFMTDAKAERGLAGFNNKGQMRVGGG